MNKPVKDFDELYLIYDDGNVWSIKRNKFLKYYVSNTGYKRVTLYKNGKLYHKNIHRLIAEAFIPNPNNLSQVNHKDENKLNNRIENLEWITPLDNTNYGTAIDRRVKKQINNKYRSKPVAQYDLKFNKIKIYPSIMEVERQTGYSNTNISLACRETYRTAYGYYWRYENE